jgi:hypothetical protein
MCDYWRGMGLWLGLLTACIHRSELHFTDHWHTQTNVLILLQSPLAVSWQRLIPRKILQLPALRCSCHSRPCRILVNWQRTGSQAGDHFTPTSYSSLHRLIFNWQLNSLTHQPATSSHFTQLNCWELFPTTDSFLKNSPAYIISVRTTWSNSKLVYDWQFTANQFVLASNPLRPTTNFFFPLNSCINWSYVTYSLTRSGVVSYEYIPDLSSSVHFRHIACHWKFLPFALYTSPFVSTGFTEQIMPIFRILCYNGSWTT